MKIGNWLTRSGSVQQLVRFLIIGGFSGIIDLSLTLWCQYAWHFTPTEAKVVGFVFGTATAFAINRVWVFQAELSVRAVGSVALLYSATFLVQVGIYRWLSSLWPVEKLYSIVAFCLAQGTATAVNFLVQKYVIFAKKAQSESSILPGE